jgi:protease I
LFYHSVARTGSTGSVLEEQGMQTPSNQKRIAFLATNGVEQSELQKPLEAMRSAGSKADVVSPQAGSIKAWNHKDWGDDIPVDCALAEVQPENYDALVLPGGVMNPDTLRTNPDAVGFVRSFFDDGKPVAAICHGPWMLVEAGVLEGRTLTSWPSLKTDIENAGATWVDEQTVVDGNLVTSRKPDDIPAFTARAMELFGLNG